MARAGDGQKGSFSNISATTAIFELRGGLYQVSVVATFGGGSVKLQMFAADGSTLQSIGSSTDFTAAGLVTVNLPPGTYQWTIATASAVYTRISRIPND